MIYDPCFDLVFPFSCGQIEFSSQIEVGKIDCSGNRSICSLYVPLRYDTTATTTTADELKSEFHRILVFSAPPLCLSLPVVRCLSSVTIPGSRAKAWDDER